MCAYYEDEQILKKGDTAIYQNEKITILESKHIKENKTMHIIYVIDSDKSSKKQKINIPYKSTGYGFELSTRKLS